MNETMLYREKLPRYVFKGTQLQRKAIKIVQWWYRLGAVAIFIGTVYLAVSPKTEYDLAPVWVGIIAAWIGCLLLLYRSERTYQAQLDGSVRTIIFEDRISIPPRSYRKLIGEPDHLFKDKIGHVKIIRGWGNQYVAKKNGVLWEDSPIAIQIITKSGKKISLGYKPPSTVKEIVKVLNEHWSVRVVDPGTGMGRGTRYIDDKVVGEYSYEEIMKMNLFEWQE
ncbi:hypothetical protein AOA80_10635 [Methanomassiliicoccales archaeon RumEn M1]|nr:hypothetical protein AOA80_10635 [Methanomassiliicoccales archaeon RumEn M1]